MLYYDSEDHLLLHRDFSSFKYRCSAVEGAPLGPVSLLELFFFYTYGLLFLRSPPSAARFKDDF